MKQEYSTFTVVPEIQQLRATVGQLTAEIERLRAENHDLRARNRALLAVADDSALRLAWADIAALKERLAGLAGGER